MKTLKRLIPILLVVLAVFSLVGCKKKGKDKSVDELNNALNNTVQEFKASGNVQAKITLTSTDTQTIDVKYSIENNKIKALATVLQDTNGEVSVYVKDGVCYIARYNSVKEKYTATDAELQKIAESYTLDAYIKKALDIFNKEFFKASSAEKLSDSSYKLTCDLASLQVSDDTPDDEILDAEAQIEKLQAMESVTLTLTLSGDAISVLEGTFVKDGKTSTIKIEFLNKDSFTVEVPNQSEYVEKSNN